MHQQEEELAVVLARSSTPEPVREQGRRAIASLRAAFEQLRNLSPEERRSAGQKLNRTKAAIERLVEARLQELAAAQPITATHLCPTLPVLPMRVGQVHPTVAVMRRMHAFFTALGFTVADGPEIESDWYNFSALNLPPEHPAREMHDTIYLSAPSLLLRTHTSAVEIRAMEASRPPLRVIVPGKAYRAESVNATNNHMFFQAEDDLPFPFIAGRAVRLLDAERHILGYAGALDHRAYGTTPAQAVYGVEISLPAPVTVELQERLRKPIEHVDLSVVLSGQITPAALRQVIAEALDDAMIEVQLIDVYAGDVEAQRPRSVTFRAIYAAGRGAPHNVWEQLRTRIEELPGARMRT